MEIDNFLPGSAALIDMIDKPLQVTLRDGKIHHGILIAYDQFANLVLDCYEPENLTTTNTKRVQNIVIVRGENVVMVGEVGDDYVKVDRGLEQRHKNLAALKKLGFCVEVVPGDNY